MLNFFLFSLFVYGVWIVGITLFGIAFYTMSLDIDWDTVLDSFVMAFTSGLPLFVLANLIKIGTILYKAMF